MSVGGCGCGPQHTGKGMSASLLDSFSCLKCVITYRCLIDDLTSALAIFICLNLLFDFVVKASFPTFCADTLLSILQSDMQRGVHGRLMDNSTSVREAAVELLGKFVLSRPQLTEQYYDMLIERILVSCPTFCPFLCCEVSQSMYNIFYLLSEN